MWWNDNVATPGHVVPRARSRWSGEGSDSAAAAPPRGTRQPTLPRESGRAMAGECGSGNPQPVACDVRVRGAVEPLLRTS
jgi:hypothetical protein